MVVAITDIEKKLSHLIQLYKQDNLSEAEHFAKKIIKQFPKQPLVWKLLGVIYKKQERYEEALLSTKNAAFFDPDDIDNYISLGIILHQLNRFDEAVIEYKHALSINPDQYFVYNNLGNTFRELNDLIEAKNCYLKSSSLKPKFTPPLYNLGLLFFNSSNFKEAKNIFSRLVKIEPDNQQANLMLGKVLKLQNKINKAEYFLLKACSSSKTFEEAKNELGLLYSEIGNLNKSKKFFEEGLAVFPQSWELQNNLAMTHQKLGNFNLAKDCFLNAINSSPDNPELHCNLGNLNLDLLKPNEAINCFEKAIDLDRSNANALYGLGNAFQLQGRGDLSEENYKQAIQNEPKFVDAYYALALLKKSKNCIVEAKDICEKIFELNPDFAPAHRMMASLSKFSSKDKRFFKLKKLILSKRLSENSKCQLYFGLAKAYEDLEEYEEAFSCYKVANDLRKKELKYDVARDKSLFKNLKLSFPLIENIQFKSKNIRKQKNPIFIVGMPRSGTTLVEQIISSHSDVASFGELPYVRRFGHQLATGKKQVSHDELFQFRENYFSSIENGAQKEKLFTDKMPHNFLYLGLISAAFPEALIVHVRRLPAAVCWGNFKQYFATDGLGYNCNLEDIVEYYKMYLDLIEYWKSNLSNNLIEVNYDDLTLNPEIKIRKLIKQLGLEWDKNCLAPELNKNTVLTASNLQIREKIFTGSSQNWEKYKPFLGNIFNQFES